MNASFRARFALCAAGFIAVGVCACSGRGDPGEKLGASASKGVAGDSVTLTPKQAAQVAVGAVQTHDFVARSEAVGYIDFDQDDTVQVFAPYQGRVRQVFAKAGDDVKKGQVLFSIDSPDLVQAESTLIAAAGVLTLTTKTLERAKGMLEVKASAQKDVEQATSDQQGAEGSYRAARNALRIFGKSEREIDAIAASRKVDGELRVESPVDGVVTARNVAPGSLLQLGNAPAPFSVSDVSKLWMVANVLEDDVPRLRLGQAVSVSVNAFPGRRFDGKITNIGTMMDPATHSVPVRSEIVDAQHELRAQMLATFSIQTGAPQRSIGVHTNAVVREGDGTMTVFSTDDGKTFRRREVKLGIVQDGLQQVLEGLSPGERIAEDGAIFLSNALALQSR